VEFVGFDKVHAPFLTERRTRGLVQGCVAGNPGSGLNSQSQFSRTLFSPFLRLADNAKTQGLKLAVHWSFYISENVDSLRLFSEIYSGTKFAHSREKGGD
jgi:hypothetical protein